MRNCVIATYGLLMFLSACGPGVAVSDNINDETGKISYDAEAPRSEIVQPVETSWEFRSPAELVELSGQQLLEQINPDLTHTATIEMAYEPDTTRPSGPQRVDPERSRYLITFDSEDLWNAQGLYFGSKALEQMPVSICFTDVFFGTPNEPASVLDRSSEFKKQLKNIATEESPGWKIGKYSLNLQPIVIGNLYEQSKEDSRGFVLARDSDDIAVYNQFNFFFSETSSAEEVEQATKERLGLEKFYFDGQKHKSLREGMYADFFENSKGQKYVVYAGVVSPPFTNGLTFRQNLAGETRKRMEVYFSGFPISPSLREELDSKKLSKAEFFDLLPAPNGITFRDNDAPWALAQFASPELMNRIQEDSVAICENIKRVLTNERQTAAEEVPF